MYLEAPGHAQFELTHTRRLQDTRQCKYTASFWVSYKLQTVPTIMALSNHTRYYHAINTGDKKDNYGTNNSFPWSKPPCKNTSNNLS